MAGLWRELPAMVFVLCLQRSVDEVHRLGEPLLDEYLRFVAARCRPNTLLAQSFDLKVFFGVAGKPPLDVGTAHVLRFIEEQRSPRQPRVVRLVDGEAGLAASTIKRRLATVSGLFDYLTARGEVARNRCRGACRRGRGGPRCVVARWCGHRADYRG